MIRMHFESALALYRRNHLSPRDSGTKMVSTPRTEDEEDSPKIVNVLAKEEEERPTGGTDSVVLQLQSKLGELSTNGSNYDDDVIFTRIRTMPIRTGEAFGVHSWALQRRIPTLTRPQESPTLGAQTFAGHTGHCGIPFLLKCR